jgi:hypothetical protein
VCVYPSAVGDGCGFDDVVARGWLVFGRGGSLCAASRKDDGLIRDTEDCWFLGGDARV